MNKPLAWSYSSLTAFETCPKRYYLTKISKQVFEPQTEAMDWGNKVHKALEHRLIKGTPLPESMAVFNTVAQTVVDRAKGKKIEAESKMALTSSFKGTTWFAKDVWVRGITDFTISKDTTVFIGDWKTGKPTPESAQLKLTAAMTMHLKPYVTKVINAFVWLKTGGITHETFTREDIPAIWQEFTPRVARLEHAVAENKFPARPSGLCKNWCPVGKSHCEHWGI